MNIGQTSLIVTLITLSLGTSVAFAQPLLSQNVPSSVNSEQLLAQTPDQTPTRRGRRGGGDQGKFLEQLNLTTEQRQQLSTIRQKYQGQIQSLREKVRNTHQELRTLMSGSATADQIRAKHQELSQLQDQLQDLRFNSMLEMRDILTPEQRTKFTQLMEQRRGNHQRRGDRQDDDN